MEQLLGCFAMITLRSPSNSMYILETNTSTVDLVLKSMNYHHYKYQTESKYANPGGMLRQGCLFFRNIAARCPEAKEEMIRSTNIETLMKQIGMFIYQTVIS